MGWPKVLLIFFSIKGSSSACLSSTLFKTILLDCIVTAVISGCRFFLKNGRFLCRHFNVEEGRREQHFQHIMFYYFKKDKNATEIQKKIFAVYGESLVID